MIRSVTSVFQECPVGVRVAPLGTRCEQQRLGRRRLDLLPRVVVREPGGHDLRVGRQVVGVVVEAGGVLHDHPHGDRVAVREQTGQVAGDRRVQVDPVRRDQLQQHRAEEHLRHAADPEPRIQRHRPIRAQHRGATLILGEHAVSGGPQQHTGRARGHRGGHILTQHRIRPDRRIGHAGRPGNRARHNHCHGKGSWKSLHRRTIPRDPTGRPPAEELIPPLP
jgi:hypothetical protein